MENTDLDLLNNAFKWQQISTSDFEKILWYNPETNVYESEGKIIQKDDPRLIKYLSRRLTPVDLWHQLK